MSWQRCEWKGCGKLADVTLDNYGHVCYDHYDRAKLVAAADWECERCGTMNPAWNVNGVKIEMCLKCYRARGK